MGTQETKDTDNHLSVNPYDKLRQEKAMMITERDPQGLSAKAPGAKLDAGKNRLGLVLGDFGNALDYVSKIGTKGAQKYSPHGWLKVPNGIERYTDAMLRHWIKESQGEIMDSDLDLPHAAAVAWNALARLELLLRRAQAHE